MKTSCPFRTHKCGKTTHTGFRSCSLVIDLLGGQILERTDVYADGGSVKLSRILHLFSDRRYTDTIVETVEFVFLSADSEAL